MLAFDFMRHAFLAVTLVGLLCGVTGWFLVLRGQAFAGHALSHIAFTGAAGAMLLGCPPLSGMALTAALAGVVLGWEPPGDTARAPDRQRGRDTATGLLLAASLGCGALFLQWANAASSSATLLLFGNILGVDRLTLILLCGLTILCLGTLAAIARPLLFATLAPDLAAARGVALRGVSVGFMVIVAVSSAACAEVTGVLLVFSLLTGPAATMLRLGLSPWPGLAGAASLAVLLGWAGLALSWWSDAPVSFWISALAALAYLLAVAANSFRGRFRTF
ncbi:metal ABC transporter permease [Acidomonas methanolica]|uniref:metal ABC transporter permease n=3 Tax=Acidomonas methanolica TaxID=437 RepID=UPI00211A5D2A|nr:metal ABC transporter permease [Acidomonas methanolica]MCQ9155965.1 metal ABC transporter permease [Acidomonas methanolica]